MLRTKNCGNKHLGKPFPHNMIGCSWRLYRLYGNHRNVPIIPTTDMKRRVNVNNLDAITVQSIKNRMRVQQPVTQIVLSQSSFCNQPTLDATGGEPTFEVACQQAIEEHRASTLSKVCAALCCRL